MSQHRQGTHNATDQLLPLPGLNNSSDYNVFNDVTKPRQPRWKRIILVGVAILLIAALAGGLAIWQMGRTAAVTYSYQQVTNSNFSLSVTATGPVQSPATYNLVSATTATIHDILVSVGQHVTQGQVLAHLDATALQDAVNQAQAQVNADQDALYNVQVNAGWVTTPAVTQARDTLNIALAQLTTAQHNLANATLKAPQSGVITAINGTVGGSPGVSVNGGSSSGGGGSSTNGVFIQIVNLSSLQIQANVNEADIANVQIGESVQFTVSTYGSRLFTGTISAISPNGTISSSVVSYPVIVDIDMKSIQGTNILPGMTASLTITVVQHPNVLLIPVSAINYAHSLSSSTGGASIVSLQKLTAAQTQANQWLSSLEQQKPSLASENPIAALVIEQASHGTFTAKPVVLGLTDGTSYEVLQGLASGERVVTGATSGG